MKDKETVTVTFLTNHEVDPQEFDLRIKKPEKIREQLKQAADPCGRIQVICEKNQSYLEKKRNEVIRARERNDK